jgi:hypothetical protein
MDIITTACHSLNIGKQMRSGVPRLPPLPITILPPLDPSISLGHSERSKTSLRPGRPTTEGCLPSRG